MAHELIEGNRTCPRHEGNMTFLGQKCSCNWWACRCGHVFYDFKLRETVEAERIFALDEAYELHLIHSGEEPPSSVALQLDLSLMQEIEQARRMAYEATYWRIMARKFRAAEREQQADEKNLEA